jgi:hypothetical protein
MLYSFVILALISLGTHAKEIEKKNLLKGLELRFQESHPSDGEQGDVDLEARFLFNENALDDNSDLYQKHFDLIRKEAQLEKATKQNLAYSLKMKIKLLTLALQEYKQRAIKTRSSNIETLNKIREIDFALKEYSFQRKQALPKESKVINIEKLLNFNFDTLVLKESLSHRIFLAESAIEKIKSQKDSSTHGMKFVGLTSNSEGEKSVRLGYLLSFGDKSQSSYDIHLQKFSERKNLDDLDENFFNLKKDLFSSILKVQRLRSSYKFTKKTISSDPSLLSKNVFQTYELKTEVIRAEMDLLKTYCEFLMFYGERV